MFQPSERTPCADDPELFFSATKIDQARATAICSTCKFQTPCAAEAPNEDAGIWGGVAATLRKIDKAEIHAEVLRLHSEGHNYSEIARRTSMAASSARYIILQAA